MKQAIAGVTPAEIEEATVMEVWPSVARYRVGRILGRLFANDVGIYIFKIGNLIALLSIPIGLALYFFRLVPVIRVFRFATPVHGSFYKLTNRGVHELHNEIHFGPGSRFVGSLAGTGGVAVALVLLCLKLSVLEEASLFPKGPVDWVLSLVILFHLIAGVGLWATVFLNQSLQFVQGKVQRSVQLDRFNTIETEQQQGQEWFDAGDLVFLMDGQEQFRLLGISRPEAFKSTCMKAQMAYVGVHNALQHSGATA